MKLISTSKFILALTTTLIFASCGNKKTPQSPAFIRLITFGGCAAIVLGNMNVH